MSSDGLDHDERLADLAEEILTMLETGEQIDTEVLAARFELPATEVQHCLRAVQTLDASLDEDLTDLREIKPPNLPADYEVRSELGRGGMGIVYRVHQKSLDREVALKVLRPGDQLLRGALLRFEREARSLARLRHRHLVSVHEVGEADGFVYFTMDLIEGQTLEQLIANQALTIAQTVRLLQQAASAIAYAHSQGVVHRDLKPANILVDHAGDAFVVDFGLARDAGAAAAGGATLSGQLIGTPAYMSPEQARGDQEQIGEATDIYALGAVLYQGLTGQAPFGDKPLAELMFAVIEKTPARPRQLNPKVPRDLEVICQKAMAKRPEDRYATVQALLDDLERFRGGRSILARPPSGLSRVGRFAWRQRSQMLIVAMTAVMAVAWAFWWLLPQYRDADLVALAQQMRAAGNDQGTLTTYRQVVTPDNQHRVGDAVIIGFAAVLNDEAGRLMLQGGQEEEVQRLLLETKRVLRPRVMVMQPNDESLWPESLPDLQWEWLRLQAMSESKERTHNWRPAGDFVSRLEAELRAEETSDATLVLFGSHLVDRFANRDYAELGSRGRHHVLRLITHLAHLPKAIRSGLLSSLTHHMVHNRNRLFATRDPDCEAGLIRLFRDDTVDETTRRTAFNIWRYISQEYPQRSRRHPHGVRLARGSFNLEEDPHLDDLSRAGEISDAIQGLDKIQAWRKRIEMVAETLPEIAPPQEVTETQIFLATSRWLHRRTGARISSRGEWSKWIEQHGTEDPRRWLLRALQWDVEELPSAAQVVDHFAKSKAARSDWLHYLLTLTASDDVSIPAALHPLAAPSLFAWRFALGQNPLGTQHVRLAMLAFIDGDPDPEILWQDRLTIDSTSTRQIRAPIPTPPGCRSLRIRLDFAGSSRESWSGRSRYPGTDPVLAGHVQLLVNSQGVTGNARLSARWNVGFGGHYGSGNGCGHLAPGQVSFTHSDATFGQAAGRSLQVIGLALLEDGSHADGEWELEHWRAALRHSIATLKNTPRGSNATNLLWGLSFLAVPGALPEDTQRVVALAVDRAPGRHAFARLMTGDPSAIPKTSADVVPQPPQPRVDYLTRLAISTENESIRRYALDQLKTLELWSGMARSLRQAVVRGTLTPPPWLRARLAAVSDPTLLGTLREPIADTLLAGSTGLGLLLGLLGVWFGRRSRLRRACFAFILMVAAGLLANLRIEIGYTQLVPAWIALSLVALALWVMFARTTARWGWTLCPLWWTGYAAFDLWLRISEERTASGWNFVIGILLILMTLNSASNHHTRRKRAQPRRRSKSCDPMADSTPSTN